MKWWALKLQVLAPSICDKYISGLHKNQVRKKIKKLQKKLLSHFFNLENMSNAF